VQADQQRKKAAFVALWPCIDKLGCFAKCFVDEVKAENAVARSVHTEQWEQLRADEARYVRANDSPSRNPSFQKVREDIAAESKLLKELKHKEKKIAQFARRWDAMLTRIPRRTEEDLDSKTPVGQKRRFWELW